MFRERFELFGSSLSETAAGLSLGTNNIMSNIIITDELYFSNFVIPNLDPSDI